MMRVETVGNATLYHGDCRDIIPTLTGITAVVTDPPYGIGDIVGGYRWTGIELPPSNPMQGIIPPKNNRGGVASIANDKNLDCCFAMIDLCATSFTNFRMLAFYSPRVSDDFFQRTSGLGVYMGEIIWNKKQPGMGKGIRYLHESVAVFEFGNPENPMPDCMSIIDAIRTPSLHPHQKPLTLMQTLCNVANGDTVLDPFMGSGSTGVAALNTRRKFIGCELDAGHFETALRRITEATKEESLF
jgi:DNA modification methylase